MGKEKPEKAEPQREEVLALLKLLEKEIMADDRSTRRLERDLGVGQGYIHSILRGRIMLKVQHIWDFGDAMGVEPLVLFYNSAPQKNQDRFLSQMKLSPFPEVDMDTLIMAMPREELLEYLRKLVRQELRAMFVG